MTDRNPAEVLAMLESEGVEFVDFRFCDLPGIMQHVTIPAGVLSEETFEDGHGFDGSSIRGFQEIQESDMILLPDPTTAYVDPVPGPQDDGAALLRGRSGDGRELLP